MFPGIALVSATQLPESIFADGTFLGRSLARIPADLRPELTIAFANSGSRARGLSEIFNSALDRSDPRTNLVFLHDDVYLNDWFFAQRVLHALEQFDVVGVAGSVNPDLTQPSWGLAFDADLNPAGPQPGVYGSGAVNHFDYLSPQISVYGPTPLKCRLLDGLLIAVKTSAVKAQGVRFDPRFRFHCYDLDFCRSAAEKGLRIGTWPLSITHRSVGSFRSGEFKKSARLYLEKWQAGTSNESEGEVARH
jgi:GT2 family glycosyltransferase